ncbi:MAG: hypothetical protein AB8F94_03720 [Saprospiraceae bacterium]
MSKFFLLFSVVFFLFSCGNPEEEIKTTFNSIRNCQDVKSLVEMLDEGSINYFSEMGVVAASRVKPDIRNYCNASLYPLSTRYMVQVLEMMAPSDSTSIIELEDVLAIAVLADFGPIGTDNRNRYKFHQLERANDRMAIAIINYKVNPNAHTYIQSKVQFSKKEGEGWKMNFQETLSFFEKYLTRLQTESGGMNDEDFIENFIVNGGKEIQFKYRQ